MKTQVLTASRAGSKSVVVTDTTGIQKTGTLAAGRAGITSLLTTDSGLPGNYTLPGPLVFSDSDDRKTWVIANVGTENAGPNIVGATTALFVDADAFYAPTIVAIAPTRTLTPGLVTDSETFYAPAITMIFLAPSLWTDVDSTFAPTVLRAEILAAGLVTDADTIAAPTATYVPVLRPALVATDDTFFSPSFTTGQRTLQPTRVLDTDSIRSPFATPVGGGPEQVLKSPNKGHMPEDVGDIIFSPSLSKMTGLVVDQDIIRAPVVLATASMTAAFVNEADTIFASTVLSGYFVRPALVVADDVIPGALITQVIQPGLVAADDNIPAADVGWQVIARFTDDMADQEAIFSVDAYAFYPLYPDVWFDEESIETYPFFVQAIEGGVPQRPTAGVLTGSLKRPVTLTGSIRGRTTQLSGSLSGRKVA